MDKNKARLKSISKLIDILKHMTTLEVATFVLYPIMINSLSDSGIINRVIFYFSLFSMYISIVMSILGMTWYAHLIEETIDSEIFTKKITIAEIILGISMGTFILGIFFMQLSLGLLISFQ